MFEYVLSGLLGVTTSLRFNRHTMRANIPLMLDHFRYGTFNA